jgi:protein-L-isoaspartate(D-aspartate) O-methyltransferase
MGGEVPGACPPSSAQVRVSPCAAPDAGLLAQAAETLAGAERPVIVAGSGCFYAEAGPALQRLAAATDIPPPLLEQLKPTGRMVIPVGSPDQTQFLKLVTKNPDGPPTVATLEPVRFVPLVRSP